MNKIMCIVTVHAVAMYGKAVDPTRLILCQPIADDFAAWIASRGGRTTMSPCNADVALPRRDDEELARGIALLTEYAHARR